MENLNLTQQNPASVAKSQAEMLDTATGMNGGQGFNPFQRSRRILRSPDKQRAHSLDNNLNTVVSVQTASEVNKQKMEIKSSRQVSEKKYQEERVTSQEESKLKSLELQLQEARKEIEEL